MTMGEKLLQLTLEYQHATQTEEGHWDHLPGTPVARTRQEIAADYEDTIRELLATEPTRAS